MKALSFRQPWSWCILHAGKDIENRDWQPRNPGLRFRGPFLIHTGATMTRDDYEGCLDLFQSLREIDLVAADLVFPSREQLVLGGIVGRARIVDVVQQSKSPWFFGPLGLVLADVEPLPFVPLKGQLGFFDVPDDVIAGGRVAA